MLDKNEEFLLNMCRQRSNTLFICVDPEKMDEVRNFLQKENSNFINCFTTFSKEDEKCVKKIIKHCDNTEQEFLFIRAYVATKLMKDILDECQKYEDTEITPDRGIVKNTNNCWNLLQKGNFVELVDSLVSFPTSDNIKQQRELHHAIDMNIFLQGVSFKPLQSAINDYLSKYLNPVTRNTRGIKTYTNDFLLATPTTTIGDISVSTIAGDYDLNTSLSSKNFLCKQK